MALISEMSTSDYLCAFLRLSHYYFCNLIWMVNDFNTINPTVSYCYIVPEGHYENDEWREKFLSTEWPDKATMSTGKT